MQIFMSDHIRTLLVCVTTTHHFFLFVLFVICLLRYYVYIFYVNWNYFGLDLPTPGYQRIRFPISIPILTHMRHLHYVRVGCCNWSNADSRIFPFFQHQHSCAKYRLFVPSFVSSLPFEVYREVSQP